MVSIAVSHSDNYDDDWDYDREDYWDRYDADDRADAIDRDDEPSYPDFGCACENALVVDAVCPSCIYNMRRQDAEAEGGLRWAFWRFNEWWPTIPARVRLWRERRAARRASDSEEMPF